MSNDPRDPKDGTDAEPTSTPTNVPAPRRIIEPIAAADGDQPSESSAPSADSNESAVTSSALEPLAEIPSIEIDLVDDDILSAEDAVLVSDAPRSPDEAVEDPATPASLQPSETEVFETELDIIEESPANDASVATPSATAAAPVARPPSIAREWRIDVPTALDKFLEAEHERSAEEQAAVLSERIEAAPDLKKGELAYELGEHYLGALGDEAKAVKSFGVALRADPGLRANLWAIRRIFYRRGLWPNLIKLIGAELRFAKTDRDRADLELERGRIQEDHQHDVAAAKACYQRAVAHDAGYLPALLALERICLIGTNAGANVEADQDGPEAASDEEILVHVWRSLADASTDDDRKQVYLLDLARALAEKGDSNAFQVLDEAAELGELAVVARERLRAARLLDDVDQMIAGLDEQVHAVLATLGPAGLPPPAPRDPSTPPDAAETVRLTVIAARRKQAQLLLRECNDPDRAWSTLEQALAARPGDRLVLADLTDLAETTGRFEALAELVESWQAQEAAPERARALSLRRVAALRRSESASGQSGSGANAVLSQLAATYPGYLPVALIRESDAMEAGDLVALTELYTELGQAAQLGSIHGEEDGKPRPELAAEFFCAAAGAAELSKDDSTARALFGRALESAPGLEPALDGLLGCLERAKEWDLVTEQIDAAFGSPAQSGADPHWTIRAAHAAVAGGNKQQALELLASVGDELSAGELLWLAALAVLCGDADREAFALETAAGRGIEADAAAEMLARAGRALELQRPERAADLYRQALAARPDDSLVRGALTALLRRRKDWTALASELRDAASSGSDPRGSESAWLELAAVYEDCLEGAESAGLAADAYREVLEVAPDNVAALAGLIRCAEGDARRDALDRASQSTELGTALLAALELASMHLQNDATSEAMSAAQRADAAERDLGLENIAGAIVAIQVAAREGNAAAIADALETASRGARGRSFAEFVAAAGWQRFLAGEIEEAATLFARACGQDRENRSALLGAILVASGEDEATAAETLADALEGDALAVSMLRGAGVHAAVSGDRVRARKLLTRAVNRAPSDLSAAIALTELTVPDETEDPTTRECADASAHARRAQSGGAAGHKHALLQVGALAACGRLAEAGALALKLSTVEPLDPAPVAMLADLCRIGGDVSGEATARLALASRSICDQARARHLRRGAKLFDAVLEQPGSAARAYWLLCEIDPSAPERARLAEILAAEGDHGSLWELYSEDVERASDGASRAQALVSRARVRIAVSDRHGAARDLSRARTEDATAADAAGAAELDSELGEWLELPVGADAEVACASFIERAQSLPLPAARARAFVEYATICRDALGDRNRAADAIRKARELDPTNLEAAVRAGQVAEAAVAIRSGLVTESGHRAGYQKLAAALELLGDEDESVLAREVAGALGGMTTETIDVMSLSENRRPFDVSVFDSLSLRSAGDHSKARALWDKIADAISRGADPSPADLGLSLSDRVGVRDLGKRSPLAAALYERLRLHAEIYIAPDRNNWSLVTSANRQMIFLSPDVADAESATARFVLGTALTHSRERTGTLARLTPESVATFFAAARSLGGFDGEPIGAVASDVPAAIESLERLLPARVLAELAGLGEGLAQIEAPGPWMREAALRADRFGLAISGNVADAARTVAGLGRSISTNRRSLELLSFAASEHHLELRRGLGLAS